MKITLNKLGTKDLATLAQRIISASKGGDYTLAENHEILAHLEKEYNAYDAVYTKHAFSGKGKEVAKVDAERDKLYRDIKGFLKGYRGLSSVPHAALAEELYQVFVNFGLDIDRLSYSAQTAQTKKLIEELEKAENKTKIKTLGLEQAMKDFKAAQTNFEVLYAEQAEANAELRSVQSASSSRRSLEYALRNYLNLVTVMKDLPNGKTLYAELSEIVKSARNSTLSAPKNKEG